MDLSVILEKAIQSQNPPNLLLYGNRYADLYTPVIHLLRGHYQLGDLRTIDSSGYHYKTSRNYHEFNMSQIKHSNQSSFWDTIYNIIRQDNYFRGIQLNVILFHNFNQIKDAIQCKLRVLVERYRKTTLFIFLTENYTGVYESLRSRFLCIRIPEGPHGMGSIQTPIQLSTRQLLKIYDHDFRDIRKCDIQKIKDISYNILKYNLDVTEFYQELLKQCLQNAKWIHEIKHRVVTEIADSQRHLKYSYRTVIHIESLLIHLYYLTSFAYYEVDRDQEEGVHVLHDAATPDQHNED